MTTVGEPWLLDVDDEVMHQMNSLGSSASRRSALLLTPLPNRFGPIIKFVDPRFQIAGLAEGRPVSKGFIMAPTGPWPACPISLETPGQ
jgi:hypothetical protein